jgi:hypothetical protein
MRRVKCWATTLAILALRSATLALAEHFKTVSGKLYKDATIIRVEADGIILRTKTGISKIYFIELPKDVQGPFRPSPSPSPAKTAAAQREPEPIKLVGWRAVMANPTALIHIRRCRGNHHCGCSVCYRPSSRPNNKQRYEQSLNEVLGNHR